LGYYRTSGMCSLSVSCLANVCFYMGMRLLL
jgi:hypothetical protein